MRRSILFLIFLHACLKMITAQTPIDKGQLENIVDQAVQSNSFEGHVLVADQGEIIFEAYHGSDQQQVDENSRFPIASITKLFTAIVILQLVEEGQLNLRQTVGELLPQFNFPLDSEITPHHLLLHISGLPNEPNKFYRKPLSPEQFASKLLGDFKKHEPVGTFNYANIDYVLLGLIIEELTQMSWQDNIQKRILEPLGMEHTGLLKKDQNLPGLVKTYRLTKSGKANPDFDIYWENYYAAGCMYSSARDLLKLDQAMYSNQLLSTESKAQMYQSYPEYNYTGYSVWTYNYPFMKNQPRIMERRGGIMGANSVLLRLLDQNQTIIILNHNGQFNPDSFGDPNNLREALGTGNRKVI